MSCFRSPFARAAVSAFLLAAAGCSLPRAIDQSLGAGKALSRVDDAAARRLAQDNAARIVRDGGRGAQMDAMDRLYRKILTNGSAA